MCGIFGYKGKKDSITECLKGLKLLEYRGYDSAGIACIDSNKVINYKSFGKISFLKKKIPLKRVKLNLAIGHTRWATHGIANEINAHPHLDHKSSLALVHNGIIENYSILKNKLLKKNIKFISETDSEIISNLISFNYKQDILSAVIDSLKLLKGSLAIALIHQNHPDEMIAACKESPLAIGFDEKLEEIIVSSDPNAFSGRNLNVIFLKNNEIAHINKNDITIYDLNKNVLNKKIEKLNCKDIRPTKNGYEHFLLKEIFDQPNTIQKAYLGRLLDNKVDFEDLKLTKKYLSKINHIVLTGCGSSYHAALLVAPFIQEKTNILISCEIASEMRFKNFLVNKNTLVIAISQSGETADTISAINIAKEKKAKILSIINVKNSSISRISDSSIFLKAGIELSVCSTKAFTSQITVLYLFALYLMELKKINSQEVSFYLNELKKIPKKAKQTLKLIDLIKEKATKYSKYESFFYLGRNLMYPTALEAALKLKEISYLNANAYPAGEMKHGPLALISSNLPVIAFCSNKKTFDKILSNLMEAKTRGAPILAFATKKSYGIEDIADDVVYIENTIDEFSPFLSTLAGQLFAYFVALKRKTNIDQPRNLAKSVTVE